MRELAQLRKIMQAKALSISQLSAELGYRSPNTVYVWFKKREIPKTAVSRVKNYIREGRAA